MSIDNQHNIAELLNTALPSLTEILSYNWPAESQHFAEAFDIEDDSALDASAVEEFEFTDEQKNHAFYHLVQLEKLRVSIQANLDNKPSSMRP